MATNNLILNVEDITGIIAEITDLAPGEGLISTIVADTGTITFADSDITSNTYTLSAATPGGAGYIGSFSTSVIANPSDNGTLATQPQSGILGWTFQVADSVLDPLRAGQTLIQIYTFNLSDGSATSPNTTVTITITGKNDAPVMANIDLVGQITEGNPSTIDNGIIQFTDPDLWTGTTPTPHTIAFVPQAATGYLGTFTTAIVDPATDNGNGFVQWTLTTTESQLNFLAKNDTRVQSYNLTLTDASGATSQMVVVTITGTNDAPVFGAGTTTGSVTEIADGASGENSTPLTAAGSIAFTDVDVTDTHTVSSSSVGSGYLGSFSASKGSGKTAEWTFSVSDGALDYLAQGQTLTQTYNVTVNDDTVTDTEVVTITLTGTNDVPTVDGSTQSGTIVEVPDGHPSETTGPIITSGVFSFADVDLTNAHTISAVRVSGDAVLGTLTPSITNATTGDGTGTVDWGFAVNNAAIDSLAAGQVVNQTFTITITDSNGGTVTKNVAIAITGTNDAPILTVSPSGSVIEDTGVNGYGKLVATGAVSHTDVDTIDTHTVTYTYKDDAVWSGGAISGTPFTNGSFSASSANGWKYKVDNSAVQFLAVGETITLSYDVTVTDSSDAANKADTETVTITITGTNDVPTVDVTAQTGAITELPDGDTNETTLQSTTTGSFSFADVDLTDAHTISAVRVSGDAVLGALTASVTNVTTGDGTGTVDWSFAVNNAAIDYLAAGQVVNQTFTITLNDGKGGTVTKDVGIAITGTNDAPVLTLDDDISSITEDNCDPTITDSGTLSFTDVDTTDTHTVTVSYNEDASWIGGNLSTEQITAITADFTATKDTTSTGHWDYSVANSALQFLNQGETVTFSYDVVVTDDSDAENASHTQTVTVTLTGVNDTPTITSSCDVTWEENSDAPAYAVVASDADQTAVLTYSLSGLDAGSFTIDESTGEIFFNDPCCGNGDYENPQDLPDSGVGAIGNDNIYAIIVTATDEFGASVDKNVNITVADVNPEIFNLTSNYDDVCAGNGDDTVQGTFGQLLQGDDVDGQGGTDTLIIGGGLATDNLAIDAEYNYAEVNGSNDIFIGNFERFDFRNFSGTVNFSGFIEDDNWVWSGAGNDDLVGGLGCDYINGGLGIDTMSGGRGNDDYYVDNAGDVIIEAFNAGIDSVYSSATSYTLSNHLENLYLLEGTAAVSGTGNNLNNRITGNSANNTLNGAAGIDTLIGGAGNDTYIVDNTSETITENGGEGTDTIQSSANFSLASLANVENLTLTGSTAINGTGNTGNNVITGNAGSNILDGGAGIDRLIGGLGGDTYIVDTTTDVITENEGEGTDTIQSSVTFTLASLANVENLTLTGTTAINGTGNAGNNILTGNASDNTLNSSGGNDTLNGGDGNDVLLGGAGNNALNGGVGIDIAHYYAATAAVIANLLTGSVSNNGQGGTDTLTGIEYVYGSNTAGDNLTGDAGNNRFEGYGGNDTLNGGDGNDVLLGGTGNDTLIGGNGAADSAAYYSVIGGATVNLATGTANDGEGGIDTLSGIENAQGSNTGGDNLTGDSGVNTFNGYGGSDTLTGAGGNDTLYLGVDTVTDTVNYSSGDGSDTVFNFVRGVGGDRLNFTAIANIDVRVSGSNTQFRVGDAIIGNSGFGTGTLLLTTSATTGFVAANVNVNLFGATFAFS